MLSTIEKLHKLLWEIGKFGMGWGRESEKKLYLNEFLKYSRYKDYFLNGIC